VVAVVVSRRMVIVLVHSPEELKCAVLSAPQRAAESEQYR
jgi:hypothetical protein